MSAQPIVSFIDGSALTAPIGGQRTVMVRFDNVPDGAPGSDVGYAPYVNLILPTNGADGAGFGSAGATSNDGLSLISATYLGVALEKWVLEFPASGQVTHPYATTAAGTPLTVTGTPGETLVVLRLPFGSFTGGQTPSDIEVKLQVSSDADLAVPLNIQASGGFAYGRDPLLNPVADNPVTGPTSSLSITPTVLELDKVYVGPEQETATGPSYPREWLVQALIANNQTITNLVLTDRMPDGTFITGASIVNGTGIATYDNATGLVVATLTGSYTGGVGGVPTLKIDFYVPEFLRDGVTPVLDPDTGAFRVLEDNARLDAKWQPTDGRDAQVVFAIDPVGPEDVITAKSIAVQKSVAVVDALKAGGHLEWTLDGQVSNYFNMDDLKLTDTLSDGQVYNSAVPVTITMREGGATLFTGTIAPANIHVVRDMTTGISTITFDVSKEMRDRGIDDVLNGQPGGVNNQATVLVKFQTTIEQSYISTNPPPSNEPLVDQGDPLGNDVFFDGVVDETNKPKGDDSHAGVVLPVSEVGKSIYAINGNTAFTPGPISAGDAITFRLTLDMPLTGAHDVKLTDFMPLPVLKALAGLTFTDVVSPGVPAAGEAKWGPGATYDSSGDPTTNPTISFNSAANSLIFDFGDAVAPGNPSSRIDLLFTVVVLDEEFGDGLLLTNQVTSTETNSFGTPFEDNAIVQFVLGEPELNITKGVIADTNANALPTQTVAPSGVNFNAPGTAGNRFTGTISSAALDTRLIDADLIGADAGDRVSFAIVVENTGSSLKGAFDVLIRDTMPAGFEIPAGGLNLRVTDGTGATLSYTIEGSSIFDPAGGIRLGDAVNDGSIDAYSLTNGKNIVVITYDLELIDNVPVFGADLVNTASIAHFAAKEGGIDRTDYTPVADLTDTAFVRTQAPTPAKFVQATSEAHTGTLAGNDGRTDATIGETVTWRITVSVPEGRMTDFKIEDYLPTSDANGGGVMTVTGARFISVTGLGAGSTFDDTPTIVHTDTDLQNGNDKVTFSFGDVINTSSTTGTAAATVTVEVDAVVRNNVLNARGDTLTNTVVVSAVDPDAPGGRNEARATAQIDVVSPNLDLTKTVSKTSADAFDTLAYKIEVVNGAALTSGNDSNYTARAWDVNVKDLLADVLLDATFQPGTLTIKINGALAPSRLTYGPGSPIDVTIDFLDPGEKVTITFDVIVDNDVDAGETLVNTASTVGSSMDGTTSTDDRDSTDTGSVTVTIDKPTITKQIIATSDANTGDTRHTSGQVDLRIGEEVTYEIKVKLPEGDSTSLKITDLLEDLTTSGNGTLTYVPGSLEVYAVGSALKTFGGAALPAPTLTTASPGSTTGLDSFTLNFGDVRNTAVNTDNGDETITIRIKAVVNDVTQNNDADVLTNTGSFTTGGSPATSGNASVNIDVVEPVLSIDKSSAIGAQALDAGAIVSYTIKIKHAASSDAPAYDLALSDLVPSGMQLVAGTLSANAGTASSIGNAITWSTGEYLLGAAEVVITYQAKLLDSVTPGQVLSNTASLTYDTNPADPVDPLNPTVAEDLASRSYNTSDIETRTVVLAPTIDKSVIATGDTNTGSNFVNASNPDAAPGETVTYRLTVVVGEGTQRLVVSDSLPTGLVFESASVETIGATISGSSLAVGAAQTSLSGGAYTFDFGTIVNAGDNDRDAGDTVTILVNARVGTNAVAGTTLTNTGKAETFGPGVGQPGKVTVTDPASIDVVRPDLVIVKDASPATGDAGNLVNYSITLSHAAGSTSPAYLVNLSDLLPAGVSLVAGSASASVGSVTESGGNISYSLGQYLLNAAPITITYQARLAANVVDGQVLTNTAQVTYSSAPTLGVSVTESDPATTTVDIVNSVVKTLESTSFLSTSGSNVGIGETVSFLVTATLGEGNQRIVLKDLLPNGLTYQSSELVSLGNITGSAVSAGAVGSFDAGTRTVSFNLGDISNPWDNVSTVGDQVVFRVVAVVADTNAASALLTNVGQVVSSAPVNPYGVTPGSSLTTVSEDEAVTVVRASLGGIAFRDTNGDGIRGAGETTVLPGITVTLLNADGSATGRTAVTDVNGAYLFDGLVPAGYRVRFDETALEKRTLANVGGNETVDSDANQASGITDVYTLVNGQNQRNVDAGYYQLANLGDRVFEDVNGNGQQDAGDVGLVGVTVALIDGLGNQIGTTVTGANGAYAFTGLVPGSYSIQVLPAGYTATTRNAAGSTEVNDSDVNATGRSDAFTLASGASELRIDAGFYRGAKLGGTLFEDVNGDGLQGGPGEGGISGRLVTLLDSTGASTGRTALTDVNGNYLFDNLAPGTYSVNFAPSVAQPFTKPNVGGNNAIDSDAIPATGNTEQVTLVSGADDRSLDAGVYNPAAIGDLVFEDTNGNGQKDPGESGLAGATVKLLDATGGVLGTVVTGANGAYNFTNLAPGDYKVEITKAGYVPTLKDVGADVSDSDIAANGQTGLVNLVSGETDNTVDGGLVRLASIGDRVFLDTDADGIQDVGELGLAGVTVKLLDGNGNVLSTTTTNGSGIYGFSGLAPSSYGVKVDLPAGYEVSPKDAGGNDATDSDASPNGTIATIALNSGDARTDLDAGLFQRATLGDRVFEDVNGNGRQDAGDVGLVGVAVALIDAGGNQIATTITAADGFYQFAGLLPGAYSIQVLPAGYVATARNAAGSTEANDSDVNLSGRSDSFTLVSGGSEQRIDAGFYRPAKLGGTLFEDVNGDGLQGGPGEGGIAGRLVTLLDSAGNTTGRTALTDGNGNYLFDNLVPGTYSVNFAPSAAQPFTKPNVGGNNAIDSDAIPATGNTEQVTLVSGADDRSLDAGVYTPAAIGDLVFEDTNGNGQKDVGEAGIAGATVKLLDASGNVIATVLSGPNGAYNFTGLAPADYKVEITKAGYVPTLKDVGADISDSDIGSNGQTGLVNLISGETDNTVDGGLFRYASLGDKVFDDADNDGIQDVGEAGLNGITVRLLSADGATVLATTTTAGGGIYNFANLAPGNYRVEFVSPADRAFAKKDQGANDGADSDADRTTGRTDVVTLTSGQNRTDVDAGLVQLGELTGRVWIDRDGDGLEETGEASRPGVTVNLLFADGTPTGRTTTTGADGTYLFKDVITGSYRVEFVTPAGTKLTLPNVGADDTIDSDPNTTTGITAPVTVLPAETTRDVDAGLYIPASLGDRIWLDKDADGVQDAGEPGLANVTVKLLNGAGTVIATTQTNASGIYGFGDLAPGMYGVKVDPLAGYEFSPRDAGGNDATDSDALANGTITPVMIFSGDARTDLDAGLFQRVSIGDRVWRDTDGDGIQDANETGAQGVTVRLLDAGGAVIATTVTNTQGLYNFANLLPGTYSVQFVAPAGSVFTTRDAGGNDAVDSDANPADGKTQQVTLTSGQVETSLDAGLLRSVSIGDRVWADRDGDGQQDVEEPGIANVVVRLLSAGGAVLASTTTDAQGFYLFDNLAPGTYAVRFVAPSGYTFSPSNVGNDATDSDANAAGQTGTYTLGQGVTNLTVDGGLIPNVVGTCDLPGIVLTPGNDAFPGTEGPDKVDGLGGNDNINGLRGDDCLSGNDGDDVINGHEGNDKIQGQNGNDNLHGNAGDDVIYGGNGNDTIEAGEGNDWAEGGTGDDRMQGEGGNDTLFGGTGNDIVEGNGGDDIVFGGAGNDRVAGHDGNDTVIGGTDLGRASLTAGRVTGLVIGDTISGDGGADKFIWQKGDGVDLLLDFKPAEGDTLTIYGYGGFAAVDRVNGQTVLYLAAHSAIVLNDFYPATTTAGPFPGITFVPGSATAPGLPTERAPISGGVGNDALTGTAGNDQIEGLQGNDNLSGLAGADTLIGGTGDDVLNGGTGADVLDGGAGTDTATYATATAGVTASLGAPAGNAGDAAGDTYIQVENLLGSNFADRLTGDNSANRITGGGGNDTLSGAGGDDLLIGGIGVDVLTGGAGADRFVFDTLADSPLATPDTITDFSWFQGDRIQLSGIDANGVLAGDQAFQFVGSGAFVGGGVGSVRYENVGADTMVLIDGGDGGAAEMAIRLAGLHTLLASDFVL